MQFERMVQQPAAVARDLVEWLGLEPTPLDAIDFRPKNETHSYRWPIVHRAARAVRLAVGPNLLFRVAKGLYYGLQHRPSTRGHGELAALDRLHEYYAPLTVKLAQEVSVDLSLWGNRSARADRI